MWRNILHVYLLVNYCKAEPTLAPLFGVRGHNRATLCARERTDETSACAGAVWRRDWLLVRASCLQRLPQTSLYIRRGIDSCVNNGNLSEATILTGDMSLRYVIQRHEHPDPHQDLSLLRLDWPYSSQDPLDNCTDTINMDKKMAMWVDTILSKMTGANNKMYHQIPHMKMYSTPVRMFLTAVILPSTSFIVFFLFVIFFTGPSKNKIPYRNLKNERDPSA